MDGSGSQAAVASSVELVQPRWRGRLHLAAFALSVPAGVALCVVAGSSSARIAAAIYALTVSGVFGASAAFHMLARSPSARRRMSRLDRAMIYLQVAGTYTPVCLLALGRGLAVAMLAIVWAGAAAGAGLVLWRGNLPVLGPGLYMLLGWPSVLVLPFALLFAGGVVYTAGAVMLVRRWPDPNPAVFGYHEVWHVFTLVAGSCHWTAIWLLVSSA